jgi:PAS domain S-box-containing protein
MTAGDRYRRLLENAGDAFLVHDAEGRLCYVNSAACDSLGYTREELLAVPVTGFEVGVTPADLLSIWTDALSGKVFNVEGTHRRKDGSTFPVEVKVSRVDWDGGDRIAVICRDATDRKRAEAELRESEGRIRSIIDSLPSGMHFYRLEPDGRLVFAGANPAADRILGVDNNRFVGKTIEEAFPALASTEIPDRYRKAAAEGIPWDTEQVVYDGGEIRGAYEVHAFRTGPGAMATVFSDITGRKRAMERLRRSEEEFRNFFRSAPMMLHSIDKDARIVAVNDRWLEVMGYSAGEVLGRQLYDFLTEESARYSREVAVPEFLVTGFAKEISYRFVKKNGEIIDVLLTSAAERDSEGRFVRSMAVTEDVTERKRAESERRKLEAQLQQAMKMEAVGRLAGGVAHDFNNLLTAIIGNIELAAMKLSASHPVAGMLGEANKAAERAAALTQQLLAFSRKQIIEPRVLDLNELISGLRMMLDRLIGEHIELETSLGEGLGAVRIDPGQFEQILANLVVNARDAMPDGGRIGISTSNADILEDYGEAHPETRAGRYVLLAVSDTGQGIPEDVRPHIFEPFFTTKPKGSGTGLGLSTIYGVAKQAGGSVEVRTQPGKGTTFEIYLPRVEEELSRPAAGFRKGGMPAGDETVLVVEDEDIVRELCVRVLSRLGYKVLSAPNGRAALELAGSFGGRIDLLVTDVVMPGMNGRETADRLAGIHPEAKVLFASGYTEDAIVRHGVLEEGVSFIAKPYSPAVLAEKIREILDGGREGE